MALELLRLHVQREQDDQDTEDYFLHRIRGFHKVITKSVNTIQKRTSLLFSYKAVVCVYFCIIFALQIDKLYAL